MAHLADTYQKKTDIEHILDAPDTYIGSIERGEQQNYIINEDGKIEHVIEKVKTMSHAKDLLYILN